MARWEYPRWRRMMMQAALCVVFGASVGLAALVSRHRQNELGGGRDFGQGWVAVPKGWAVISQNSGDDIAAKEPDSPQHNGRDLTAVKRQLPEHVRPLDLLRSRGILDDLDRDSFQITPIEKVDIGGYPGIVLSERWPADGGVDTRWIACSVGPDNLMIVLILECPAGTDPIENKELILKIVKSVAEKP